MKESGKYVGFCCTGLSCQLTENFQLRKHFGMWPLEMTGVLASKINPLSDAHRVLKKDDVILAFDGIPITNDGTGSHGITYSVTQHHLNYNCIWFTQNP